MSPERLVTIDPGTKGCGVAVFEHGLLVWAEYVTPEIVADDEFGKALHMAHAVYSRLADNFYGKAFDELVLERPKVHTTATSKGDPDDLIRLALTVGAIGAWVYATHRRTILPREWKGQVPKNNNPELDIMISRIKKRLNFPLEDRVVVRPKRVTSGPGVPYRLQHNVWDAVGIGLWALGRYP